MLTNRRSEWPRRLRRRSSAVRLLRSWVRIPPRTRMFVCCECCVLSGRGLCDGLITRPEESHRMWRVVGCDKETSKTRRLKPATGLWKIQPQWVVTAGKQTNKQTNNMLTHRFLIALLHVSMFIHHPLGRDSSAGIATRYGMEGSGIESRWGRDFHNPLEAHPASYTKGTESFRGGGRAVKACVNHPPHLRPMLKEE
jgi:hypothetical protein